MDMQIHERGLHLGASTGLRFSEPARAPQPEVVTETIPPLLVDLVSYWSLDEASGSRNDSHGSNHLSAVNAVGSAEGVQGNAAMLSTTAYLSAADDDTLRMGDVDFTIACWAWFTSLGAGRSYADLAAA